MDIEALKRQLRSIASQVFSLEEEKKVTGTVTCSECGNRGHNIRTHEKERKLEAKIYRLQLDLEASQAENDQLTARVVEMYDEIRELKRRLAMIVYGD